MKTVRFLKGHGTENDFVLLPDADGTLLRDLTQEQVAWLCDRRAGLGGDGVIRVVRTTASDDPAAVAARDEAEWFMDYRNADGSVSEMCGNGIRVLGRYLVDHEGHDPGRPLPVATRDGVKILTFAGDGEGAEVTVDMGEPQILGESTVGVPGRTWTATHVDLGNPHAVAFVDDLADAGALREPPTHDPAVYPEGVNVEFVVPRGAGVVAMRVHERGSGETRSCGTGACAVGVAVAMREGRSPPDSPSYDVHVPGGRVRVTWRPDGRVELTGPAVIVAEGTVRLPD